MGYRALVTGCAGFVGSHVVEHLLQNTDWEIVGLCSFKHKGDAARINSSPRFRDPRYKILTCDLSAPISQRLSEQIGPVNYILNIASQSHVDRSIDDPVPFVMNNTALVLNMLEYARTKKELINFIQLSTDEVYGAALEGYQHKEWDMILPSNPYSASKAGQEAIAISYWRTYDVPVTIINCMNLIGERQDKEKFIPMIISKVMKGETISIHGTWEYIGKRHYLHCRNLADAMLYLIKNKYPTRYYDNPTEIVKPDRYHVVGEVELDNLELAQTISIILNKPLKYELVDFHKCRPGHDRRYCLDGNKIKALGWKQPMTFKDSLIKTVEWTLNNPEWL